MVIIPKRGRSCTEMTEDQWYDLQADLWFSNINPTAVYFSLGDMLETIPSEETTQQIMSRLMEIIKNHVT
jgi:hypothetical protein